MGDDIALFLGVITAVVALATGVAAFMSALISYNARKEIGKSRVESEKTRDSVHEVHVLVNNWREQMEERVKQLTAALVDSGKDVPDAPSKSSAVNSDLPAVIAALVAAAGDRERSKADEFQSRVEGTDDQGDTQDGR